MPRDLVLFVGQLLRNPREVSAIVPSSRALATAMARGLGPATGRVVEFGPGTGKLTRAILDQGVAPSDLTLYEMNPAFCDSLRVRFPGVRVINAPAQEAAHELAGVGAVISGLPLLSIPPEIQRGIIGAAFAILRPGAPYIQFTYGPNPPVTEGVSTALNLRFEQGPRIWQNLPPARVYRYTQG
ncbi:MAG TPA: methyltransferase type 12 [Albidovulum sp.]|uniref:class I SAM-dependent methyltransferase n=1 Tax=Albidovulum sp. TaxID=1872424 RepID=UPI002B85A858|nr:methyltransferase type 12 [Albidovulum sp.]